MKKISVLILCLIAALSFCLMACNPNEDDSGKSGKSEIYYFYGEDGLDNNIYLKLTNGVAEADKGIVDVFLLKGGFIAPWNVDNIVSDGVVKFTYTITGDTINLKNDYVNVDGIINNGRIKFYDTYVFSKEGDTVSPYREISGVRYYIDDNNECSVVGFAADHTDTVKIAKEVEGATVTKIKESAFENATDLKHIELSQSVTEIGKKALYGCINLESITVDEENEKYGSANNCLIDKATQTIILGCKTSTIPDINVRIIGDSAFKGVTGLTEIDIPLGIEEIESNAFENCVNLTTMSYSSDLYKIGANAFKGCGLKSVIINKGIISLGAGAFSNCQQLKTVTINKNVADMGKSPFEGSPVEEAIVPSGSISAVKSIYLKSLKIMSGELGGSYLSGCPNLRELYVDGSVEPISSGAFSDCKLDKVSVSVKGTLAISVADGAREIVFLTRYDEKGSPIDDTILAQALSGFFHPYTLETVTIPVSIKVIQQAAFANNEALKTIIYQGTMEQWKKIKSTSGTRWDENTGNYEVICTDGTLKKGEFTLKVQ